MCLNRQFENIFEGGTSRNVCHSLEKTEMTMINNTFQFSLILYKHRHNIMQVQYHVLLSVLD